MNQSKFQSTYSPSDYNLTDLKNKVRESRQESSIASFFRPLKSKLRAILNPDNPFANRTSYSEIDPFFIEHFLLSPYPFGITLSVDEIGSTCQISQNATLGTNAKFQRFDASDKPLQSVGYKPRLGHLVIVYPGSIVSGPIEIGNCVIISGGSIVTKDIPSFSIVRGVNEVHELQEHHFQLFLNQFHQHLIVKKMPIDGVLWKKGRYYKSEVFTEVNSLFKLKFPDIDGAFIKFLKEKLS